MKHCLCTSPCAAAIYFSILERPGLKPYAATPAPVEKPLSEPERLEIFSGTGASFSDPGLLRFAPCAAP